LHFHIASNVSKFSR